jgi:hypothetical protein
MKSKIKILFTVFLCSISSVLIAQSVDINMATAVAKRHLAAISKPSLKSTASRKNFQFTSVKATVENNDTLYYILNDTINKGFVIVSADKRAWPILAYSTEGSLNEKKQPDAFAAWMENRKQEIESIKLNNLRPDSATTASWQNLNLKNSTVEGTSVEPLIQTQWDQGCYYNSMCPIDTQSPFCGHVPTGCTITAMAQIMKYWNYPTKGAGTHSYNHSTYGNLSADFGSTTYQWSQMPNSVTSPNDAVATLMYHCGVSLETDYSTGASAAYDPRDELIQYFNYSSNAMLVNRSGLIDGEWIRMLKSELDLRHPIWYQGSGFFAHSFICDGYQNSDYFHFNWGWSGSSDGYFYIGNLNPAGNTLNENQYALIRILPGSLPDGYNGLFLSSNAVDVSLKGGTTSVDVCSSANWTASSNQSWLLLSTNTGGSGKTTFILTAIENNTGSDRIATVTISSPGFSDQTITVNQLAKVNVTPGGLQNLIAKNATSITKLTLSGTIDARDFKTMRDAMPSLTDVDLSEVTIVAYSGTEGPLSPDYRIYHANEIPDNAFPIAPCVGQNYFKSFILPSSITSIGSYSFYNCKFLTSINIPASVTNIGVNAFGGCNALINVDSANLNYSSIDGVLFDKNKTSIIHCPISKTGNYTIPSSVTSIIIFAFESCEKLSGITIPTSVTSVEELAFTTCSASINVDVNNPNFSGIDGVLFNKEQTKLIHCPTLKTGSYIIPSSVVSIEKYAFMHCYRLESVSISSSVIFIGDNAFSQCLALKTVSISSSVTSIGVSAFHSCKGLLDLTIPLSVARIEMDAFNDCINLRSIHCNTISPINFTPYVTIFRNLNKSSCTLYVPYGSKDAYQSAPIWKEFTNIIEMPGLFLSNNNISIGPEISTVEVVISSSSTWAASSDQTWLTAEHSTGSSGTDTITFAASENPTSAIRSATITISATGLMPQTIKVTQYGRMEVTAGNLKTMLVNQLSTITSLTLSGTIDARDFKTMRDEMSILTNIDLSRVKITSYYGNEGTIDTNNNLYPANGIPGFAFYNQNTYLGKSGLKSVILPLSATTIGNFAFNCCSDLTTLDIPLLVTNIGAFAFNRCTGLSIFNIPASVNSISNGAFGYINGKITVHENNTTYFAIDDILFNKNRTELIQCPISKTGEYVIPSSVNLIGESAFGFCMGLTKITISSSVKTIRQQAFYMCENLNSIYALPLLPVDLNSSLYIFWGVDKKLCTLYVPYGSKQAYQSASVWKDFTNVVEMPGFKLSATTANIKAVQGSTCSIDISSNVACSISSNQSWLKASLSSTTGTSSITFEATENPEKVYRSAIVTVSSEGVESQTITVNQEAKNTTGIDQISKTSEFKVYPNPTNGKIKLIFERIPLNGISVTIDDISGKNCVKQKVHENEVWLDLKGNASGIYFIKTDQENLKAQKVILK